MTHTPGPWSVSNGELLRVLAVGTNQSVCGVHRVGSRGGIANGDPLANARLIAAAPDLLAALKDAPDFGGEPKTAFGREYREWQERARAAIAKAEGAP